MDDVEPWERQYGEPHKAFAAFVQYRDAGPNRSGRAIAAELGVRRNVVERWMQKHAWYKRAEAWDRHLDLVKTKAAARAIEEMAERHTKIAVTMQDRMSKKLESLSEDDINKMSFKEMRRWIIDSVKLERLSRGEPETINKDVEEITEFRIRIVDPQDGGA